MNFSIYGFHQAIFVQIRWIPMRPCSINNNARMTCGHEPDHLKPLNIHSALIKMNSY